MTSATVSTLELFERYADGIYTVGMRILRDRHLAEDVVQDTFIKILRGSSPYTGEGSLSGWIYRIGYNQALDALRKRRETPLDATIPEAWVTATDESAETKALARDLADAMDEAINELPDTLKVAFVLRDVEELSTQEVAEVLGIGASAVKMRLARAREQLRERLGERLWD
jgi:RNA polymerase sigma-70 factor (ECF subfamily)